MTNGSPTEQAIIRHPDSPLESAVSAVALSSSTASINTVRRPSGIIGSNYDEEIMAGYIHTTNVDTDLAKMSVPAAASMEIKVDKDLPETATMTPLDLTPLAASTHPSWPDFSTRNNTPKNRISSESLLPSIEESFVPKLYSGSLTPSFNVHAMESTNASQVPSTSTVENIYVEEDEIEMDSEQLVPSSTWREIESSSPINPSLRTSTAGGPLPLPPLNLPTFNSPRSLYPPRVQMPMESRHFDVTYGYAETVEETRIPSSTSGPTTPSLQSSPPTVRLPLPPPDIIPPSSSHANF